MVVIITVHQLKDGEDLDVEFSPYDPQLRECSNQRDVVDL